MDWQWTGRLERSGSKQRSVGKIPLLLERGFTLSKIDASGNQLGVHPFYSSWEDPLEKAVFDVKKTAVRDGMGGFGWQVVVGKNNSFGG